LLGVRAPPGGAPDRCRVPGPMHLVLAEGATDATAAPTCTRAVRPGRCAGPDGLADGDERARGPTQRQPLPPRRAFRARAHHSRLCDVARPRAAYPRGTHEHRARAALTPQARPRCGRCSADTAGRMGCVHGRAQGRTLLSHVPTHGRRARSARPAPARAGAAQLCRQPAGRAVDASRDRHTARPRDRYVRGARVPACERSRVTTLRRRTARHRARAVPAGCTYGDQPRPDLARRSAPGRRRDSRPRLARVGASRAYPAAGRRMTPYYVNVTILVLAALLWLGGMFFLAAVCAPLLRRLEPPALPPRLLPLLS